ncbi:uncharacterized protein FIBRA_03664 [Fibroporia radiculosa]|uniref:Rpr2-domain-containing protein n=1 Tax=Fibroporia radiculosa TaxID=599839 RepID=J4H2I9_9APHY|nr:uncharacterized protein FIBRA_03664 [Fibroporia radiculosa]CCM01604.1 predicted protein [Fibroporia radiculosa]
MQAAAAATARFQFAVPYILQPVSPGLAALHASRARSIHPTDSTLRTTHCRACGASYLEGGHIRTMRSGNRKKGDKGKDTASARVIRMSCEICGHKEDFPVEGDRLSSFIQPRKRRRQSAQTIGTTLVPATVSAVTSRGTANVRSGSAGQHAPAPARSPSASLTSNASSSTPDEKDRKDILPTGQSKARSRKLGGLQGLLARNREKREQIQTELGLSSFLRELG